MQVKKNRWRGVGFLLFWGIGTFVMMSGDDTLSWFGITEERRLPLAIALFFIALLFNLVGFFAAVNAFAHPIDAIKNMFSEKSKKTND